MTIKNHYPLPRIDNLFDQVGGAKIFSNIDLWFRYHQVQIHDGDIHKTPFHMRYEHYEFVVIPFGLTNASTNFMCMMNNIFSKYLDKFVLVFIDNILVYSKSKEENEEHLRIVLWVLREHQLYAKFSKCDFYKPQIQYLGHIISDAGIAIDPKKIQAIKDWPTPTSVTDIRFFFGFIRVLSKVHWELLENCFPHDSFVEASEQFLMDWQVWRKFSKS